MKKGQNDIDYITGEIIVLASSSPFLDTIRKKNLNGSLPADPADEYAVQQLKESDGEKLEFMMKEGLNIEEEGDKNKPKELKTKHEPFTKLMKE
eukprot:16283994-Heterocapsa_arctica.AAC.1